MEDDLEGDMDSDLESVRSEEMPVPDIADSLDGELLLPERPKSEELSPEEYRTPEITSRVRIDSISVEPEQEFSLQLRSLLMYILFILVIVTFSSAVAYLYSFTLQQQFTAVARLKVRDNPDFVAPDTGNKSSSEGFFEQYKKTLLGPHLAKEILKRSSLKNPKTKKNQLTENEGGEKAEIPDELVSWYQAMLDISWDAQSRNLQVAATTFDPAIAARAVNAYLETLTQLYRRRHRRPESEEFLLDADSFKVANKRMRALQGTKKDYYRKAAKYVVVPAPKRMKMRVSTSGRLWKLKKAKAPLDALFSQAQPSLDSFARGKTSEIKELEQEIAVIKRRAESSSSPLRKLQRGTVPNLSGKERAFVDPLRAAKVSSKRQEKELKGKQERLELLKKAQMKRLKKRHREQVLQEKALSHRLLLLDETSDLHQAVKKRWEELSSKEQALQALNQKFKTKVQDVLSKSEKPQFVLKIQEESCGTKKALLAE